MAGTLYLSRDCDACQELKQEAKEKRISLKSLRKVDCDKYPARCDDADVDFAPTLVTAKGTKIEGVDQILSFLSKN